MKGDLHSTKNYLWGRLLHLERTYLHMKDGFGLMFRFFYCGHVHRQQWAYLCTYLPALPYTGTHYVI